MKQIGTFGAMALCALLAGVAQARQAQTLGQAQVQNQQQAQQAQQARQQAEAYLRKEEAAATGRQTQRTDQANQDAAVHDETAGHSDAARPARSSNPSAASGSSGSSGNSGAGPAGSPPPSYGPVLKPRQPPSTDPARKDPAEVRDETDSLMREAPPPSQNSQQSQPKQQKQARQIQRRHPAWQPAGPLAPRPLGAGDAPAIGYGALTIPPPAQAPQPVVPSTTPLNCVGGACRDAAGGSYNLGPTGTGVSSTGRLCSSNGTTVQCF